MDIDWQPIETAPKGDDLILAWGTLGYYGEAPYVVRWVPQLETWKTVGLWESEVIVTHWAFVIEPHK